MLTTSFPRFCGDHAGSFVLELAKALVSRGHQIDILAPEPAEDAPPPGWDGVQVHWVPYLRPKRLQRTFYGDGVPDNLRRCPTAGAGLLSFSIALAATARRFMEWDALISHWALPCAWAGGVVAAGRPHLAVLHSADVWGLRMLPAVCTRMTLSGTSATWFVSHTAYEQVQRRAGLVMPALRAPMGVHFPAASGESSPSVEGSARGKNSARPMAFGSAAPTTQFLAKNTPADRAFTLLVAARLVPIKGIPIVIQALRQLSRVRLLVAGDGSQRRELEDLAQRLEVRATFPGFLQGQALKDAFASADAIAIPSVPMRSGRVEGVPTVALEAAVRGLPIIASRTGALHELLGEDGACWTRPGATGELRAAIVQLRDDQPLRQTLGDRVRHIAQHHRWSTRAEQVEQMLWPVSPPVTAARSSLRGGESSRTPPL